MQSAVLGQRPNRDHLALRITTSILFNPVYWKPATYLPSLVERHRLFTADQRPPSQSRTQPSAALIQLAGVKM